MMFQKLTLLICLLIPILSAAQIVVFEPRYQNCNEVELQFIDPPDICTNCWQPAEGTENWSRPIWVRARYRVDIFFALPDGSAGNLIKRYFWHGDTWNINSNWSDLPANTDLIIRPFFAVEQQLNSAGSCVPPQPTAPNAPNGCNPRWILANSRVNFATTEFLVHFGEPTHNDWQFTVGGQADPDDEFCRSEIINSGGVVRLEGGAEGHESDHMVMISRFDLDGENQSAWVSTGWRSGEFSHDFNLLDVMQQKGWEFWSGHTYKVTVALRKDNCVGWVAQEKSFKVLNCLQDPGDVSSFREGQNIGRDLTKFNVSSPSSFDVDNIAVRSITSSEDLSLTVFPNPATDNLRIGGSNLSNQTISYRIIDVNGRTLKYQKHFSVLNSIELSEINTGIYFIQIEIGEEIITKRFTVVR